jgi:hypothetical protein
MSQNDSNARTSNPTFSDLDALSRGLKKISVYFLVRTLPIPIFMKIREEVGLENITLLSHVGNMKTVHFHKLVSTELIFFIWNNSSFNETCTGALTDSHIQKVQNSNFMITTCGSVFDEPLSHRDYRVCQELLYKVMAVCSY